jgi:amino acid transporter
METNLSIKNRLKRIFIGKSRSLDDKTIFHKLSLIAFFAWVGLGADGISSSCYGPSEAFLVLGKHHSLGLLVALGSVLTIFVISASYSQIIELFPNGGGGYLVATRLLSPTFGMVSGSALLIDYVLTIAVSVSSGADALFSFLPAAWYGYRISFALFGVVLLILMNLRGVKESVIPLVPIFLIFLATHIGVILYAVITHLINLPEVAQGFTLDVRNTHSEIGWLGMLFLILRSYSMGAGTFTGIEAVSNGIPLLREPKVHTAKRTMTYMAASLSVIVVGLMLSYLLYRVEFEPGKTLNAVLFNKMTSGWGVWGPRFVFITLFSEAVLLFVAAQTGFLDGPRVLSNMAMDRWVPTRFATLSDRLVTQNGILIMGGAAILLIALTRGSVAFLIVLYAINVFITFTLSQLGMVRHWWTSRHEIRHWKRKMAVNSVGLSMTLFILMTVTLIKFGEGGWITLLVTGALIAFFALVKRHYSKVHRMLKRLDTLVTAAGASIPMPGKETKSVTKRLKLNSKGRTAVLFVNGFNGLGLHTLFSILRQFRGFFTNFVFVQVGVVDASNFKGVKEIRQIEKQLEDEGERYVQYMKKHGIFAEGVYSIGVDVVDEIVQMAVKIQKKYPDTMFFGGQLIFSNEAFYHRGFHNYTIFSVQKHLHFEGIPVMIMPIRVY